VLYGIAFLGQHFPKSEASTKGLSVGDMLKEVGILGSIVACGLVGLFFKDQLGGILSFFTGSEFFGSAAWSYISWGVALVLLLIVGGKTGFAVGSLLLFILFATHALVGAVELGTDGWIQNITGNILTPAEGKILFVFTSLLMFALRFCAHFIEKSLKVSPIGLLFICAILAVIGLRLVSGIETFVGALAALAVYALGKTFFWPTMLAVVGDRFPRTGAIAMSIMGGVGMMSAGLLGGPGLGYAKDRFTTEHLTSTNPALYEQYKAPTSSKFLFLDAVTGLDGTKLSEAQTAKVKTPDQKAVVEASIIGDRKTLKADSFIPATMAAIFLILFVYFKSIGGYRPIHIDMTKGTAES
jgi:DHA2 family metal-tetracycline-proton antiporter-like MFS transporter